MMTNTHHLARIEQCQVIIDRIIAQPALLEVELGRLREGVQLDPTTPIHPRVYSGTKWRTDGAPEIEVTEAASASLSLHPGDPVRSVDEIVQSADECRHERTVMGYVSGTPINYECLDCGKEFTDSTYRQLLDRVYPEDELWQTEDVEP